ncbi:PQQ-binding-like beta-propeller repeat protein [Streptomyces alboflavus]|uniref:outer membrane protein assembly factor BamB family protein n=1 Tax=Streptomyces alboflavus TaxID=67267 RepID=UPI003688C440
MTNPPPPQSQPPQPGGFGPPPPQQPQQGGQAGGFGPPVEPPPGGYGQPAGNPQGPYAQPGPYSQPGGFGPPQPVTTPDPTPGGGGRSRGRAAIIGSAVLAVALIVGGGVWYATQQGDDEGSKDKAAGKQRPDGAGPAYEKPKEPVPADPKAFFKGAAEQPKLPKGASTYRVKGSWLTDKVYAKASVKRITGLDAATGKDVWKLDKPGMSCAGSTNLGNGNIAVVVTQPAPKAGDDERSYAPCTEVMAFDVDTGEKLWTKSVSIGYQKDKTQFNQATITGNTVALSGLYGGAAFDLRSGKLLWKPKLGEKCRDVGYGGGDRLVAVRSCGELSTPKFKVELLDPATGKPKWSYGMPEGVKSPNVISTWPVVVGTDSGEITTSGASDIFSLDDRGKLRTKFQLPDGQYMHTCGTSSTNEDCKGIVAGNGKLYVATARRDGDKEYTTTNDIVVFSLATGKTTGQRLKGGDEAPIFPLRMDGGNVLVYKSGPYARVYSVHGRTMKQTLLLDATTRPTALPPLISEVHYKHNKLYLSSELLSRPVSDRKSIMMMGFAAK